MQNNSFTSTYVLGSRIDYTTYDTAADRICKLALQGNAGYVCVANVHLIVEAYYQSGIKNALNSSYLTTPDGMPLVWALRRAGFRLASRVCGPELTPTICRSAQELGISVGFYGSTDETLRLLKDNLNKSFPFLNIGYIFSPPFKPLTKEADQGIIDRINASKIKIIFVGLGCPKQEKWMLEHKDTIMPVMVGVGAAFDFLAGTKKRAPACMQKLGLEWLYRFSQEPARLWKRYLWGNTLFILLSMKESFKNCQRNE